MRPTRLALLGLLLVALSVPADEEPDVKNLFEKKSFTSGSDTLAYRFLAPAAVEGKKTYPLVIFLHGAGERGDDNTAQLKHGVTEFAKAANRKKYACFVVAPQCPAKASWADFRGKSKDLAAPAKLVLDLIEQTCKDQPIDKNRIYLTGLSMGGYGSWDLLAHKPDLFAAAVPVCGGGDPKRAAKFAKVPIWAFHGDKDTVVRPEKSREMIEALKKAGGKPEYTEYKGVGHDSWTQTYRDPKVIAWLFEQKKD